MRNALTAAGCERHQIPEHLVMCSELYIAAFEGNTVKVIGLLARSGASAEAPAENGRRSATAPTGCSTDEVTGDRSTLLHIAAWKGHCDLIAQLCRWGNGSLITSVNSSGYTPLHCAAGAGHAGAVEAIIRALAAGANVEEGRLQEILRGRNEAGDTPLHLAARHGHGEAAEALVRVDPGLAAELNGAGVSSLYLAVMSGSVRAVRAILWCRNASAVGPKSQNALHAAVLQSSEMVSLLLQWKPALLSDYDSSKSSPLHFASSDGDCSIIQEMLTHAPPSTAFMLDNEGLSPLHVAALMGHAAIVHLLLQFCPSSADIRDNYGRTFLHAAAMKGHSSIISYAIKKKILEHLLNAQDKEGNTTLHLAVIAGECKVVSKLLSSGKMQANIMNNVGHAPTDLIKNCKGFYSMGRLVLKLYASGAQFQPQRQDYIDKWNVQDIMKWRETTSKNLAVVSTLVATIAFSAAFNIPGSYGNDGRANLAGNSLYSAFLILDTFSVVTSVMATILLVYGRASRSQRSWLGFMVSTHFLWLSLNSMVLGFFAALAAVMSKEKGIKIAMSQLIYYGMYILTTLLSILAMPGSFTSIVKFLISAPKERQRHTKRQISRQYPFAIFYIVNAVLFVIINSLAMASFEVARNLSY
uniref:PGG domain-containing protein n=1 Tax=Oryza nivara TaxID=4536 RepID=A0A0E0HYU0_ORYNI